MERHQIELLKINAELERKLTATTEELSKSRYEASFLARKVADLKNEKAELSRQADRVKEIRSLERQRQVEMQKTTERLRAMLTSSMVSSTFQFSLLHIKIES